MRLILTGLLLLLFSQVTLAQSGKGRFDDSIANGVASYYHEKFVGRKTSTGEVFSNEKYTAASNSLSLNTYVKVTNLANGKYLYVRINDRMSKNNKRIIDMASVCAKKLEYHHKGLAKVKVEVVPEEEGRIGILAQAEAEKMFKTEQPADKL